MELLADVRTRVRRTLRRRWKRSVKGDWLYDYVTVPTAPDEIAALDGIVRAMERARRDEEELMANLSPVDEARDEQYFSRIRDAYRQVRDIFESFVANRLADEALDDKFDTHHLTAYRVARLVEKTWSGHIFLGRAAVLDPIYESLGERRADPDRHNNLDWDHDADRDSDYDEIDPDDYYWAAYSMYVYDSDRRERKFRKFAIANLVRHGSYPEDIRSRAIASFDERPMTDEERRFQAHVVRVIASFKQLRQELDACAEVVAKIREEELRGFEFVEISDLWRYAELQATVRDACRYAKDVYERYADLFERAVAPCEGRVDCPAEYRITVEMMNERFFDATPSGERYISREEIDAIGDREDEVRAGRGRRRMVWRRDSLSTERLSSDDD